MTSYYEMKAFLTLYHSTVYYILTVYYKVLPVHEANVSFTNIKIEWNGYERTIGVAEFNHVLRYNMYMLSCTIL